MATYVVISKGVTIQSPGGGRGRSFYRGQIIYFNPARRAKKFKLYYMFCLYKTVLEMIYVFHARNSIEQNYDMHATHLLIYIKLPR